MTDHRFPEDIELVRLIRQRNQHALSMLYDRYSAQVYGLAYRILSNKALAEEVTQDTFLKVWNHPERWDSNKGRFSSWLLTVARNTSIDLLRKERRQATPDITPLDKIAEPRAESGIPHDAQHMDGRMLRQLLSELPPEQATAIEMAFFRGLTHRELAEKLNLPLGTVKTRVRLGLQKLRAMWIAQEGD